jgi:hypothetical protein
VTATYPPRADVRECRLYRFYVTDPLTGVEVLGYVGETGRQPSERLLEHLATQPWFDTVVRWEIDPQRYWGKRAVLEAEAAAIRAELPLYNVKGNETNRDRIPPPSAIRQRRARDLQKGAVRWVHPDDRGGAVRVSAPTRRGRRVGKPWRPWQKHLLGIGITWKVLAVAALALLGWRHLLDADAALTAWIAALPSGLWGWFGFPGVGKRWRRRFRGARRRFR